MQADTNNAGKHRSGTPNWSIGQKIRTACRQQRRLAVVPTILVLVRCGVLCCGVWLSGAVAACRQNQPQRPLFLPIKNKTNTAPTTTDCASRYVTGLDFTCTSHRQLRHILAIQSTPTTFMDRGTQYGQRSKSNKQPATSNKQQATRPLFVIILPHFNNEALRPFLHHHGHHVRPARSECRRPSPQSSR